MGRRTSETEETEGPRGSSLSAQLLEIQAGTRPHGGQGLLSEESLVDSTPLKIWSWVRYQVETGQEEMLGRCRVPAWQDGGFPGRNGAAEFYLLSPPFVLYLALGPDCNGIPWAPWPFTL